MVNQKKIVNLDLGTLKYPPMAIASILHRISGCLLFLLLPVMLYFLSLSLASADSFNILQEKLTHPLPKLFLWAFASSMAYHTVAGIRHLMMDLGFAEELHSGRSTAILVIALGVFFTIALGIWIW